MEAKDSSELRQDYAKLTRDMYETREKLTETGVLFLFPENVRDTLGKASEAAISLLRKGSFEEDSVTKYRKALRDVETELRKLLGI